MIILVLNVGIKNARCIAFSDDGRVLCEASRCVHTFINNDCVEQNPSEWLSHSWEVIGEVVTQLGSKSEQIEYLTVTTSASCLVVTDENYKPLMRSLLVSDTRAVKEAERLERLFEFQELQGINTKSSPDLMILKILWIMKNKSEIYSRAKHFLNIGDFLVANLTGRCVTDFNNASKFHYILRDKSYPKRVLEVLNISIDAFPEVVNPGEEIGSVLPAVADRLSRRRRQTTAENRHHRGEFLGSTPPSLRPHTGAAATPAKDGRRGRQPRAATP